MSLDQRAGTAARELLEHRPPDTERMLVDLRRTRRQRVATRYAAAAVAVVLVAASWAVLQRDDGAPEPAEPIGMRNGEVVVANWQTRWHPFEAVEGDLELPEEAAAFPHARFAADGQRLVYPARRAIHAIDVRTGDTTTLGPCLDELCRPAISPDGTELAFGAAEHLKIQSIGSGDVRPILTPGVEDAWLPTWSPDGTTLAFTGLRALYTVDVESGAVRELVRYPTTIADFLAPAWSPDGERIAFLQQRPRPSSSGTQNRRIVLMTVNADGTGLRELHPVGHCFCAGHPPPSVAWSPDGELIAAAYTTGRGAKGIYTIQPDGTDWELMYPGIYGDVTWQPVPEY